jgi:hypothetical protein
LAAAAAAAAVLLLLLLACKRCQRKRRQHSLYLDHRQQIQWRRREQHWLSSGKI